MNPEQLTGKQVDGYERVWTRVMLASGATLITALVGMYVFWGSRTRMLVCSTAAVASIVVLLIAAAKLRELERGLNGSDREKRDKMHSALEGLDD